MNRARALAWGRGVYRVLLVPLQPPSLRRRYGPAMDAAFEEQLADAVARRGWRGWSGVILRTARGTLGAWIEREAVGGRREPGRGGGRMGVRHEIRSAGRRLRRSPGFTAVAVGTLAVGVGAFASVFGVVAGVLVAPLPYDEPHELTWIWRDYWGSFPRGWLSGVDVVRLRQQTDAFEGVAALRTARVNLATDDGSRPQEVPAILGSPGWLGLAGLRPARGPGFTPVAFAPDAPDEVILSHGLWERSFGADPALVGRDVRVDGVPYRVVGVLPEHVDFRVHSSLGEPRGGDLYFVLDTDLSTANVYAGQYAALARLRPDRSPAVAESALARVSSELDAESFDDRGLRLWAVGLKPDLVDDSRGPLTALLGAAAFLLLILGANLATLLLARTEDRIQEASVRSALGASRRALASTALAEPALLAGAGLAGGLLLGAWATPLLANLGADVLPRAGEVAFGRWTVVGGVGSAAVVMLLAAAGPLVRTLALRPGHGLRSGTRAGTSRASARTRSALVVSQVALTLALVVGAGLLTRSLQRLLEQDPGFDPGAALTFRVSFRGPGYDDDLRVNAAQEAVRRALLGLPGVAAVGHVGALPLSMETDQTGVRFPGAPGNTGDPDEDGILADVFNLSEGYAAAAGLRLLEGRTPRADPSPETQGAREVMVDDIFARRFFPSGGAVGGLVTFNADTARIVGVVDQARLYAVERDDRGQIYVPAPHWTWSSVSFAVRPRPGVEPLGLADDLREAVAGVDPGLPVEDLRLLREDVGGALASDRLNLQLAAAFALTALFLAGLGVYGVVAGTVARRRREIGVRMAMGADPRRVAGMVLTRGLRLAVLGGVAGLVLAALVGRGLSSHLFGVTAFDLPTYLVSTATLVACAVAASWLPARRATRIPPREALRGE